jgi:hypothetical protein
MEGAVQRRRPTCIRVHMCFTPVFFKNIFSPVIMPDEPDQTPKLPAKTGTSGN